MSNKTTSKYNTTSIIQFKIKIKFNWWIKLKIMIFFYKGPYKENILCFILNYFTSTIVLYVPIIIHQKIFLKARRTNCE